MGGGGTRFAFTGQRVGILDLLVQKGTPNKKRFCSRHLSFNFQMPHLTSVSVSSLPACDHGSLEPNSFFFYRSTKYLLHTFNRHWLFSGDAVFCVN